ncbi:MAG: hypothetical protein KF858_07455 [Candidatus Sumerlaeia bacterium]|nr:hypothetical protein [Candidatus Sumerlaeia bacterium]
MIATNRPHTCARRRLLAALLVLLALPLAVLATPRFTLSGVLQDGQGNPLPNDWNVPTQLVFYATETSETDLETVDATSDILRGIFTAQVPFPNALLVYDEIWYTLAIDTNRDGIDAGDLFEGRFRIAQVPLAVATSALDQFDIAGGTPIGGVTPSWEANKLHLREFRTPPSGVVFNRIVSPYHTAAEPIVLCNIGIYNSGGELVYTTNPFLGEYINTYTTPHHYYSIPVEGTLEPNTVYYAAFTTTSSVLAYSTNDRFPIGPSMRSHYQLSTTAATLPTQINPQATFTRANLNFALWLVDDSKSAGKTSPRVGTSKEGIPIYAAISGGDDAPADAPQP